jgi:hypothetical protein
MGASHSVETESVPNPEPTPTTEPTMESEKPYEQQDASMDWFWPVI